MSKGSRKNLTNSTGLSVYSRPQRTEEEKLSLPHLRRVAARVRFESQIFDARVLLNDISPEGIRVFSSLPLVPGDRLEVTLFEPRLLSVQGLVVERFAPMRQGHILTNGRTYPYRMSVEFQFSSEDERLALAEFVNELFSQHGIRSIGPIGGLEFRDSFV